MLRGKTEKSMDFTFNVTLISDAFNDVTVCVLQL